MRSSGEKVWGMMLWKPLLLCSTEVSWVGSAWIHSISCHHPLNTQLLLHTHWIEIFKQPTLDKWPEFSTFSLHCTDVKLCDSYPIFHKWKSEVSTAWKQWYMQCCTPIVLKWPFRAACMWLRHQLARVPLLVLYPLECLENFLFQRVLLLFFCPL